uniref:Integrase, catalytic region, zinc finger, CCHC-type, peptidase aspartic, catalytic n=1 Tax=Tanacetum cinerariifolium TaxID=118510 RepID=A0A6L2N8G3_TANCI|nr:integrase, catalytic region, zinc finger, CCHC-type, peptidase aspartic, catalytic [Tanacetum cinerariifolium]
MAARKPRQPTVVTNEESVKKKTVLPIDKSKKPAPSKQTKPIKEKPTKPTPSKKASRGKMLKAPVGRVAIHEPASGVTQSLPVVKDAPTRPSTQPQDDTSANVVRDTPSPTDAETGTDAEKSNSKGDTEILNVNEERGENVSDMMALKERIVELDEGQARSDHANLSEDIQCAGLDTRPPMLDRTDFASWQQRIRLYFWGKENGVNILKSIDEGPFQMGTFQETLSEGNEDIQCAGSDTRPPMLDRTNFASWQQRIRLYYRGKENGVDILKSINEGPFQMGMFRETLAEGEEGAFHLGPERHRVYCDLSPKEKDRGQGNDARGVGATGYEGAQNRVGNANSDKMLLMQAQENVVALDEEQLLFIAGGQDNVVDEDVDEQPVQDLALNVDNMFQANERDAFDSDENGVALDEEQLLFIAGGQDNAVDEDVDEQPVQDLALNVDNMFQANEHPVYDEAGPSYDSNILSEVHDHDHYQDAVCEYHEVHEMHDDVQPNYAVNSHADYTSDSNMIPYDQYVKDNGVLVVQSSVSSIPNDAYMMILYDMHEQPAQHVSVTTQDNVVDNSLFAELATYKEQVELYERRPKFELT